MIDRSKVSDKDLINELLKDEGFRKIAESEIGKVHRVQVDWKNNEMRFYGERAAKVIPIDAALAELRHEVQ